jgi:UDPglucose--hexose-1-phosphate uridylyltransferase
MRNAHRRFNPLRNAWVLVSPSRLARPWQGHVEASERERLPVHDSACYLCPGNVRANGAVNPPYTSTFAFDNDFAALEPAASDFESDSHPLLRSDRERGVTRVLCFSPRHDLTLPVMELTAIHGVVDAWAEECDRLAEISWTRYALVFENRGAMMGASNPHPHCQIWATEHVPDEPALERAALAAYRRQHGSCLLCDYAALEVTRGERVVCLNDAFVAVVPFWAVWPFETIVIAREHLHSLAALSADRREALADILKRLTTRYDNLFAAAFPYSMGFHQAFRTGGETADDHLHAHFYPPLLRSATVRKFMVGFELLGSPQRDLTPEEAARRLQDVPERHYSLGPGLD